MTKARAGRIGEMPLTGCKGIELDAGQRVRCVKGSLWLTFDGEPGDVVLAAGQAWTAPGRGLLVIQPLAGTACVALQAPLARGRDPLDPHGERLQAGHLA